MSLSVDTLFQNTANVSADRAATTNVYINTAGNMSNTSGLNWFQRNFQPSSEAKENQNTLANFKAAIENSPKYRTLAENDHCITVFFQRKQMMGTPLTAAHVQAIQNKLEGLYQQKIASAFQQQKIWGPAMAPGFTRFCVDNDMPLDTEPEIAAAFKGFAVHASDHQLKFRTLRGLQVPLQKMTAALELLHGSPAWQRALNSTFAPGADFSKENVQQSLQNALKPWAEAMAAALEEPTVSKYLENNPEAGRKLLIDVGEMLRKGTLPSADVVDICKTCIAEGFTLSTPAGTYAAVLHLWKERLTTNMLQTAIGVNFPPALGQALAKSPQCKEMLEKALYKHFPPPTIPTAKEFTRFMEGVTAISWTAQKVRIGKLFDLAKHPRELSPGLQGLAGDWSEERICKLLPLLLKTDELLDHLLVPENRADAAYLELAAEFQAIANTHGAGTAQNILALLLGARGADEAVLGTLLDTIIARTKELEPSLHALYKQLSAKTRKVKEPTTVIQAQKDITNVRNALQSLARFAHAATTQEQHAEHNAGDDADQFVASITVVPQAEVQPKLVMHQAVTNWGSSVNIDIVRKSYPENEASFTKETARLYGGKEGIFASTKDSKELLRQCAEELGMLNFDENTIFDSDVYEEIHARVTNNEDKILTEQEVRAISKDVFLAHMAKLKVSQDYIRGLPEKEYPIGSGAFYMTPEEKQVMLKHMAYHSVRDEELLKAAVLAARAVKNAVGILASSQSTPEERYRALRQIAAAFRNIVDTLPGAEENASIRFTFDLILAVAVNANGLNQDEKKALHDFLASEDGEKFGRAIITALEHLKNRRSNAGKREHALVLASAQGLDKLRTTLAVDLGIPTGERLMVYQVTLPPPEVPTYIFENSFPGETRTLEIQAHTAMSAISPPLTEDQWEALRPVLMAASSGTGKPFDSETSMRFMAAYAHEILNFAAGLNGAPLTVGHLWHVIFNQRPGWFLNESNFADRMYTKAMKTLYARARAVNPGVGSYAYERKSLERSLSQGVPLADICQSCRPGGLLTLNNLTTTKPTMPPLPDTHAHNNYSLADTWRHKKENSYRKFGSLHIQKPGETKPEEYAQNPALARQADPTQSALHSIVTDCRALCGESQPQLKRVLQCFSPAAVEPLCKMSELLPGTKQPLSKDAPLSILVEKEGENVRVQLANHPGEKPWGVHISILVAPDGTATYEDVRMVRRG